METNRDEHAARVQRMLWPLAARLQEAEDTLDAILELMPDASEDMLAASVPPDLLMELEGGIFFLLNDDLRKVVVGIKRLATVSDADYARNREPMRLQAVN
jgi:hypothetical protein